MTSSLTKGSEVFFYANKKVRRAFCWSMGNDLSVQKSAIIFTKI